VSLALFALAATEARAQVFDSTRFAGTFTLPFDAQWGAMALPAGDYSLSYGKPFSGGIYVLVVVGKAEGSPRGMIFIRGHGRTSATKNALVSIREGSKAYFRELRLGAIGESVDFTLPHGVRVRAWVVAGKRNPNTNTQLTEVGMPVEGVQAKCQGRMDSR
jgi:hypothetical protein